MLRPLKLIRLQQSEKETSFLELLKPMDLYDMHQGVAAINSNMSGLSDPIKVNRMHFYLLNPINVNPTNCT